MPTESLTPLAILVVAYVVAGLALRLCTRRRAGVTPFILSRRRSTDGGALAARCERLERIVESLTAEVDRLSEGQRFLERL